MDTIQSFLLISTTLTYLESNFCQSHPVYHENEVSQREIRSHLRDVYKVIRKAPNRFSRIGAQHPGNKPVLQDVEKHQNQRKWPDEPPGKRNEVIEVYSEEDRQGYYGYSGNKDENSQNRDKADHVENKQQNDEDQEKQEDKQSSLTASEEVYTEDEGPLTANDCVSLETCSFSVDSHGQLVSVQVLKVSSQEALYDPEELRKDQVTTEPEENSTDFLNLAFGTTET